jgi:hypothetical protein
MGQKANKTTLQLKTHSLNNLSSNTRNFVKFFNFIKFFEFLLLKKNVLIVKKTINFDSNSLYLNLFFYYKSIKSSFYKRKYLMKSSKNIDCIVLQNNKLKNLFKKSFKHLGFCSILFNIKNININVNKKLVSFFYQKLKKFINNIFIRRFNLFIDFIKINSLYVQGLVSINSYLYIFSLIFRSLSKKIHSRFLFFIKNVFKILIFDLKTVDVPNKLTILGLKFAINGKLKGKPRSSVNFIKEGNLPLQTLNKSIDFSRIHSYTLMGVFGLKLWVLKK